MIAERGAARQLQSGRWVIEVEVDAPSAELLLAPMGARLELTLEPAREREAPASAAPETANMPPTQAVGDAGAGDSFLLGGGRTLSTTQERTMRFVMALVAMPPFQQYALAQTKITEAPDTQLLAQQYVVEQCGSDLLSDRGLAQLRGLDERFKAWSAAERYELTFHAELP